MALPKLNATPMYEMTIPSTGQVVRYRPYLVKEEKIMMLAFESGDTRAALNSVIDTIDICLEESANVNVNELSLFDIEYMFVKLRSKSVGEVSNLVSTCINSECKHKNPIQVDLETLDLNVPEGDTIVPLTDNIKVELKYPSYKSMIQSDIEKLEENPEVALELISKCIVAILTDEERINAKDESVEDLKQFIESMTSSQFQKVAGFFENMPRLEKNISYNCQKCGKENMILLKGLDNFF